MENIKPHSFSNLSSGAVAAMAPAQQHRGSSRTRPDRNLRRHRARKSCVRAGTRS